jgi:alpha-beta hydrolase superfamily lysophospholipase
MPATALTESDTRQRRQTGIRFMEKSKRFKKILRWVIWVLIVQLVLINVMAALYAYRLTHFYNDPALNNPQPGRNIFSKTWKLFTGPRNAKSMIIETPSFPYETVTLITASGLNIETWLSLKTDTATKGAIILFHGIGDAKDQLLDEAEAFLDMGYHVMLVDFRAHGNSEGYSTSIGLRETEEVKLAYDYLKNRGDRNIFLFGSSMGAITVIKAVCDYSLPVSGIILQSPFASLQSHLKARARNLGFPAQPFAFLTTLWIGIEKGYNGYGFRTSGYAKKIDCPVLLQWGRQDAYVKEWEINKVYKAVNSPEKKFVIYENGLHESLFRRDRMKWRSEVGDFLEKHR